MSEQARVWYVAVDLGEHGPEAVVNLLGEFKGQAKFHAYLYLDVPKLMEHMRYRADRLRGTRKWANGAIRLDVAVTPVALAVDSDQEAES